MLVDKERLEVKATPRYLNEETNSELIHQGEEKEE